MRQNNSVPLPSFTSLQRQIEGLLEYTEPPVRRGKTKLLHREAVRANMKRAHTKDSLCVCPPTTHIAEWKLASGMAEGILQLACPLERRRRIRTNHSKVCYVYNQRLHTKLDISQLKLYINKIDATRWSALDATQGFIMTSAPLFNVMDLNGH